MPRVIGLLVAAALLIGVSATPVWAAGGTYLALGDSVSAGFGADPGAGFVDDYFAYLRDPAHGGVGDLVNLAAAGESSSGMRVAGGQLDRAVAAIDGPGDIAVVTLDIGGNDFLANACPSGYDAGGCAFKENWPAILDRLVAALANDPGDETFQVLAYYNPATGSGPPDEAEFAARLLGSDLRTDCGGTGTALGLNDVIVCVGRSKGATPVDAFPTFQAGGTSLIASDRIHPNAAGHALIACLFEHPERGGSATPCVAPPSPSPTPSPSPVPTVPPPVPLDTTAPVISFGATARQAVMKRHSVRLVVITDEPSTVTATGRIVVAGRHGHGIPLRPATRQVRSATGKTFKLKLSRKALARTRRLLHRGRRLSARVTIQAVDLAGNVSTRHHTLRIAR